MLDSAKWKICILARRGFTARAIQRIVRGYEGEEFSIGAIRLAYRDEGIYIMDYRQGYGPDARVVVKEHLKKIPRKLSFKVPPRKQWKRKKKKRSLVA